MDDRKGDSLCLEYCAGYFLKQTLFFEDKKSSHNGLVAYSKAELLPCHGKLRTRSFQEFVLHLVVMQETLFIIKNAKLFRTKATDIFQVKPHSQESHTFPYATRSITRMEILLKVKLCPCHSILSKSRPNQQGLLQVIDTESKHLQNVITFENGAAFVVDSELWKGSQQRLNFKFSAAKLQLPSKTWKIPPFGKGW